jgi:hypothetical protein
MKTAKLGALFLVSIMALAGTGAAYACWWDYLYIEGTVYTGEINIEWSLHPEDTWDTEELEPGKDQYSWIEGEIIGDILYVYLYNGYPCIDYYLAFDVYNIPNDNSIPVHFRGIRPLGSVDPNIEVEVTGDFDYPIPLELDAQIHPGEEARGFVHVHLDQPILQNEIYSFAFELVFSNWNCDEDITQAP